MPIRPFDPGFVRELEKILRSEVVIAEFDSAGRSLGQRKGRFTGDWELRSLEFDPRSDREVVVACLCYPVGQVVARIHAEDFQQLIGKRQRDRRFNDSKVSDLTVVVSTLIEEQVLWGPADIAGTRQIRIAMQKGD